MTSDQYDAKKIAELKTDHPAAKMITIIVRGHGIPKCQPDEVQYIKATGGQWGMSSETRIGSAVREWEHLQPVRQAAADTGFPEDSFFLDGGEIKINWSEKFRKEHPGAVDDVIAKLEVAGWRQSWSLGGWQK